MSFLTIPNLYMNHGIFMYMQFLYFSIYFIFIIRGLECLEYYIPKMCLVLTQTLVKKTYSKKYNVDIPPVIPSLLFFPPPLLDHMVSGPKQETL